MASKTLTAIRGDLRLGQTSNLGFTVMNYNQQTLSDKVRLGEEPMSNTMVGVDASTKLDLGFLTDALNILPSYYSKEISQFSFKGEAAYMLPDPNTKKSTIESDGGKGIAYIDDFEGLKRTIPLGIGYTMWHYTSAPKYLMGHDPVLNNPDSIDIENTIPDSIKVRYKGKTYWYNQLPSTVQVEDIWPERKVAIDQKQVTALTIHYDPTQRGVYNYWIDSVAKNPRTNWGGLMKVVSSASTDLVSENINYIEFWLKVTDAKELDSAKLLIDLGRISEDVIPDGKLNTEDGIHGKPQNDRVMEDEDVGLDGLKDSEEQARWKDDPRIGNDPDPSGDNYEYSTGHYEKVNGTENNRKTESGLFPDTEDINRNGNLDLINSYFEYEVPLDTTGGMNGSNGKKNPYIVGGGLTDSLWYQFRIPLINPTRKIGTPDLTTVQFVRIWFTGTAKPVEVRIVDLELVGSQWIEVNKNDSTMTVSNVSIEETPGYVSPPGVVREQDKTKPNENVLANEQSLVLKVRGLKAGDSREAVKKFSRPLDLFSYRTLKMFVRSDPNFHYDTIPTLHYDAEFFIRFGLDSLNYYEYYAPLRPPKGSDAAGQWTMNNVEIIFSKLTSLKQGRDSVNQVRPPEPTGNDPPGSYYTIYGQPTLTQIKQISVGVRNHSNSPSISGDVWLDELRVIDPDATPGWAARLESTLKLADLATATVAITRIDPYFHTLDQRFGNRNTNMNWSVDTKISLDRFLPTSWAGSALSVSYTHTEQLSSPLYLPGTDMLTEEAAQRTAERVQKDSLSAETTRAVHDSIVNASQTLSVTDTWAVPAVKVNLPSKAWYVQYLLNRFSFSFTYTKSKERSPIDQKLERWSWNTTMSYSLTFGTDNYFSPFQSFFDRVPVLDYVKGWKLFYTPQNFTTSMSAQRSRANELQRGPGGLKPVQQNFTANRAVAFLWKFTEGGIVNPSMDYSLNIMSSLVNLELDSVGNQRRFSKILKDIFFSDRLIDFGIDNAYDQRINFVVRPRIPPLFKLDKFLDVTSNYSSGYRWSYNISQQELGKSAGVSTSLNVNTSFKLKQFTDPWFPSSEAQVPDSLKPAVDFAKIFRTLVKTPFLEYENVALTFAQTSSSQNGGIRGRTGFGNFWGRAPFFQASDPELGPSRLYQLGLISSPSDRLTNFKIRPSFPFFSFDVEPGLRAPTTGVLIDNFAQTNRFTLTTSRELWKGARIDLKWNLSWSFNRNVTLNDTLGRTTVSNVTTTGDLERSFFTIPQFLFFKPFKSGIDEVGRLYEGMQTDTTQVGEKLAKAFEQGFETLPFLTKILSGLVPRLNYSFRWDGLESLPYLKDVATHVSFNHAYQSTFNKRWRGGPDGMSTESERISYGFQPLADISIQFKEFWKGSMNGSIKYATQTTYDLNISTAQIVEGSTEDISVTLGYSRRGFEIPLFGLSLSNDIDVSLTYTYNKNSRKTYTPDQLTSNGTPFEGSTRTVLEPRIKYVLSMRVSASMYYRRTSIVPDQGSHTIGQTTSEFGFDIKLSIGQ